MEISISEAGQKILKTAPLGGFMKLNDNLERLPEKELQQIYDALEKLVELYGASDIEF